MFHANIGHIACVGVCVCVCSRGSVYVDERMVKVTRQKTMRASRRQTKPAIKKKSHKFMCSDEWFFHEQQQQWNEQQQNLVKKWFEAIATQ